MTGKLAVQNVHVELPGVDALQGVLFTHHNIYLHILRYILLLLSCP
jgi:hypothetical protein